MRTLICLAALAATAFAAIPVAAQDRSATLAISTADYANPARFEARLERAARRVCAASGRATLTDRAQERACVEAARDAGMGQFGVMMARYEAGMVVLASR